MDQTYSWQVRVTCFRNDGEASGLARRAELPRMLSDVSFQGLLI